MAKSIFICAPLTHRDNVMDREFNINSTQPYLERQVECYQWEESTETRENRTMYHYKSIWSKSYIDSSRFKERDYNNTRPSHSRDCFKS